MPTITLNRDALFASLGRKFTDEEFSTLCFEFGIELDEVTSEKQMLVKEQGEERAVINTTSEDIVYKVEVPANRYDLLCLEGISRALRVFLNLEKHVIYTVSHPENTPVKVHVRSSVQGIRPFMVAAVLRNVTLNETSYRSLMDLQEKLHQTLCRRRTLVAIGTHDLDTLQSPIFYEARAPSNISFVALNRTDELTAAQLLETYKSDVKLKRYAQILEGQPLVPVVFDARGTIASLPPVINSEHSKIKLSTRNIFIECTGTDLTKAGVVLNTVVTMFSQYATPAFCTESVCVSYENGKVYTYPNVEETFIDVQASYIRSRLGLDPVSLPTDTICQLLSRMCLPSSHHKVNDECMIHVRVPPTRSDILHACDVMEDVAISFGYNALPISVPKTSTVAVQLPINKLTDYLRLEMAMAGYTEALTLILCSHADIFENVGRVDSGNEVVVLANPKSVECEIVRSQLLPGLLKTVASNKQMPLPLRLFEVSDVVLLDNTEASSDVGARNERRACVLLYGCNNTSGFEAIHGMVDRIMETMNVLPVNETTCCRQKGEDKTLSYAEQHGYSIEPANDLPQYFPGRCASICIGKYVVGSFGIIHPSVLKQFDLMHPCSALEINVERFL